MEFYQKTLEYSNRMIASRLKKDGRLLDVGSAECPQRTAFLAGFCREAVMLDVQKPYFMPEGNLSFLMLPAEDASPEKTGFFDDIILSNVLEHLDVPVKALQSMKTLMAPGASIHILSPNCESLNRRMGVQMGILKDIREIPEKEVSIGHKHAMSVADIEEMAAESGLKVLEKIGIVLKPLPTPEMLKWPEERLKALFELSPTLPPELCHEVYFRLSL